jgi:DNA-binding NarL/FixJ family response regulator
MFRDRGSLPVDEEAAAAQAFSDQVASQETLLEHARRIRDDAVRIRHRSRVTRSRLGSNAPRSDQGLSARESQVLVLLAKGLTTKAIANTLQISLNTAKYHVSNVYRKLGIQSRAQAVLHSHGLAHRSD